MKFRIRWENNKLDVTLTAPLTSVRVMHFAGFHHHAVKKNLTIWGLQ